jgi:hypothetical protein
MTTSAPTSRRVRNSLVALLALGTLFTGVACSPAAGTGSGSGGTFIPFGPLTIPLPPIKVEPPSTTLVDLGCSVAYKPIAFYINNATVTIPGVLINPGQEIISVPNIKVNLPQTLVGSPAAVLHCPLGITASTQVNVNVPGQVKVAAAVINLKTMTLTINNPSFTLTGVGLQLAPLGLPLVTIPLPPIVTVPFGSISFHL